MEPVDHSVPGARRAGGLDVAILAAVCFLGISRIWLGGYSFGSVDNACYIPAVQALASGDYSADYIYQNAPNFSVFFFVVSRLSRVLTLEPLYFALYAAASVAAAAAVYMFALRMLGSRSAAVLAVVLLLIKKHAVASTTTWDPMLLPRVAAMAFMIFGWLALLERRFVRGGIIIGIAFAIHPLSGIYTFAIVLAFSVVSSQVKVGDFLRFAAVLAPFVVFCVWYSRGTSAPFLSATAEWRRAMLVRNVYHLTRDDFLTMAAMLVYGVWAGTRLTGAGGRGDFLHGATVAAAVVFAYVAGALTVGAIAGLDDPYAALIVPPIAATLQPLRISGPFGILILVATAGILEETMHKGSLARAAASGAAVAICYSHRSVGVLLLAAALVEKRGSRLLTGGALALFAAGYCLSITFHKPLFLLMIAVLVISVLAAMPLAKWSVKPAHVTLAVLFILVAVAPASWSVPAARALFGKRPSTDDDRYSRTVSVAMTGGRAFTEAALWASQFTQENDVMMVPPWWKGFRTASGRPVFGTWKDGALIYFRQDIAGEWLGRMAALNMPLAQGVGPNLSRAQRRGYGRLNEEAVRAAAARFGADYVVRREDDMPHLLPVYSGDRVYIYRIDGE